MRYLCFIMAFLLSACATPGPVLYPNTHLKKVGEEQARRDIAECEELADVYTRSEGAKDVAANTAGGATAGAVVGGAVGAAAGNFGRGLGIGAAGGAASGLVRGAVKVSRPSPVYKRFVERCLRERGYEPIGWQ